MRWLPALALVVLAVAGCNGGGGHLDHYVALGDSYTAGTGAGPSVSGAGAGCGQVTGSYPRLVARKLDAALVDASCAGAQTTHGTQEQITNTGQGWPPQLDSLSKDTDLVTVGLGFNDLGFFSLLSFGCAAAAPTDPTGTPCEDLNRSQGVDVTQMADQIGDHLRDLLEKVRDRAPHARVLLVGYPQLVPADGSCPQLPLATGDRSYVRDAYQHLDDAMRKAAHDTGATFVDVWSASAGHDICAGDDAWVNGATATAGAAAYHPFASGQRAVADLVLAAVRH